MLFLCAVALTAPFVAIASIPARVNLAKYQEVGASSQNGTYAPSFAVDGIASNFYSFRTTNTEGPHWLEIGFPRPVPIASAHVYTGLNHSITPRGLRSFHFEYLDGLDWMDVPGSFVTENTDPERIVIFSTPVTTDRIRLVTTEGGSRVIRQLALFPPNLLGGVEQGYPIGTDVRLNLAHKRPTTASSQAAHSFPNRAVDGYVDTAAGWLADGLPNGQFLEIDLLEDHRIGSIHLYSGLDTGTALSDFVIERWQSGAWQPLAAGTVMGNTETALHLPVDDSVSATRYRLRITHPSSSARVHELLLFPPRPGGYPLGQDVTIGPLPSARWDDFSDSSWRLRNGGPDLRLALVEGAVVFGHAADGVAAIEWQLLLNHRDGSYRLRHPATGHCLALSDLSMAADTPVVVEEYSALPHQHWFLQFVNASEFALVNAYSGLALQPADNAWAHGTPMVVRPLTEGPVQRWRGLAPRHYPKKGLAATGPSLAAYDALFPSDWSYTWGRQLPSVFSFLPDDHTFNPMQWGNFNWIHGSNQGPPDLIRNELQSNPKPTHFMAFNEPDKSEQANMGVPAAINRWPRLEALDVPLVSPAPANAFNGWLEDFFTQTGDLGYRVDYTAVHWYAGPNAGSLINHLQNVYNTFGRPVWLTEFSVVRWSGTATWTHADNYHFLAEFMWRAEALPWLKRYSLFHFIEGPTDNPNQSANDPPEAPRSNSLTAEGERTIFGDLYASWDGVAEVLPYKAYHIHNRGHFQRMDNPVSGNLPAFVDPSDSGEGTQWVLVPGLTPDTVRILSARDGRPLRYLDSMGVTLGTVGQTNPPVEWRLVPDQHGWFFIEYPQADRRLRNNGDGTYGMVSTGNSGDPIKWRFIVPLTPDPFITFATWTDAFLQDLPASERTPQADPDRDGLANLLEYAFGSNPTQPGSNPLSLRADSASTLTVEFPWNVRATRLQWRLRGGPDLQNSVAWPALEPQNITSFHETGVHHIRVTLSFSPDNPLFFVLDVFEE